MKILVTGGAGFIGGNFLHYMVQNYPQDQMVNLDLLTYAGNLETVKSLEDKPNYRFVHGDIADSHWKCKGSIISQYQKIRSCFACGIWTRGMNWCFLCPGHDLRYAIDPTKMERELGWKPEYTFDTGMDKTIKWYLSNKEWWQRVMNGEYRNYIKNMYDNENEVLSILPFLKPTDYLGQKYQKFLPF